MAVAAPPPESKNTRKLSVQAAAATRPAFARLLAERSQLPAAEAVDRLLVLDALGELLTEVASKNALCAQTLRMWGAAMHTVRPPAWRNKELLQGWLAELLDAVEEAGQIPALLATLRTLAPGEAGVVRELQEQYAHSQRRIYHTEPPEDPWSAPPLDRPPPTAGPGEPSGPVAPPGPTPSMRPDLPDRPDRPDLPTPPAPPLPPGEEIEELRDLPPRDDRPGDDAPRLVDLRLDTAVPQRVIVGRPFRMAVAVKLPGSPVLNKPDLPAVESGDLLIEWPQGVAAMRLRFDVDAPDCSVQPPDAESFRIFAGRDGPTLYYLLTPKRRGPIAIVVTVYVEGPEPEVSEPLGAAGLSTEAELEAAEHAEAAEVAGARAVTITPLADVPAGSVEVHVQSTSLSKLYDARVFKALEPMWLLLVDKLGYDRELPLQLARRAMIDIKRIDDGRTLTDHWLYVVIAAHNSGACPALVEQAIGENPATEAGFRAALAHYTAALATV